MSNNAPQPLSRISAWFPVACLALSATAYGLRAPARLAHSLHRFAAVSSDGVMRDEHVMFPMPATSRPHLLDRPIFLRR
jgi:hypothetical protein